MNVRFEWDPNKAASNRQKHGISFPLATRVFADPFAVSFPDRVVDGEQRWQTIGMVDGVLLLLAAYTVTDETDGTERIRIISARRADRHERRRYEDENGEL